jgi:two-component system LytT family sensor kinase
MAFEGLRSRWYARQLGSDADLATFRTLHTASLASPALREGLNPESVERSLKHLRNLLGTAAVAIADTNSLLGYDGLSTHHAAHAYALARRAVEASSTVVAGRTELVCETQGCLVEHAIASPLVIDDRVAGALVALTDQPSASLLRATEEVASWVSGQLELAELDESRHRLMRAEVRALRAQISPHFIYNSLGAIASFVRTDPDRARELLLEFADFTRYSFRQHGDFTTLAEELRSVERYLLLEQARFGDRLRVTLQVAPEVLGVSIPFLCLQPLVENAVQHGLESVAEGGQISIEARDADRECVISIEDNGAGQDPERIREALSGGTGGAGGDSVGLANVDERLRTTFGDEYGLVVETAPGAGTKVVVRVPKFAPGVTA